MQINCMILIISENWPCLKIIIPEKGIDSSLFTLQENSLKLVLMWVKSLEYATGYNCITMQGDAIIDENSWYVER